MSVRHDAPSPPGVSGRTAEVAKHGNRITLRDLGGTGRPALFAHAAGMHGAVWAPVAARLSCRLRSWSFDLRGHGDSEPFDPDRNWEPFAEDVVAAADSLGGPSIGIGHSLGAAAMLMAELVMPATFDALILYEPAVARRDSGTERVQNQFASVARRRRSEFRTLAEARANFAGKEPTKSFDTEVLDAYTEYGFVPTGDGGVRIKCAPESEAAVYESDGSLLLWDRLRPCPCQVTLVRGSRSELWSESSMAELAARVGARVHTMDGSGHFGPLQHPDVFADLLSGVLDRL